MAAALAAPLVGAAPASATPSPNGCKNSTQAGAEIGHFPAQPAAHSSLKASCTFNNQPGTSQVSASFRINDFPNVQYHNGAGRTVTGTLTNGTNTFTAANCAGMTAWVNRGITRVGGIGIPPRTFVRSISGACLVTLSNNATASGAATLLIDNVDGPRSRTDVSTTNGSATITSATANFLASDVGQTVSGTDIVPGTTIAAVVNATTATMSANATATAAGSTVSIGSGTLSSSHRSVNDGQVTSATNVNSPAAARFLPTDIGLRITGPGIPANTFITARPNAANVTTTGGMTPGTPGQTIVIGEPSATAPVSTDQMAFQGVQLDLSPSLVAGSESCAAENAEGFSTVARWNPPGSYSGAALFNTPPANTKTLGQLLFDTAVVDFSGFIVEVNNPFGPNPFAYSIVFPNAPTALAMCTGTATSPGLGFSLSVHATTMSISTLPTGTGRPGTAQFRSINAPAGTFNGAGVQQGYATAMSVESLDPLITFSPAGEFLRSCVYPAGAVGTTFVCGNG